MPAKAARGPVEVAARWAVAAVLGVLLLGGVGSGFPGGPYVAWAVAGFAIALMVDSYFSAALAAGIGILGFVFLSGSHGAEADSLMILGLPAVAAAAAALGTYAQKRIAVRYLAWAVALVIISAFVRQATLPDNAPAIAGYIASEPAAESYDFDPAEFVKTYYMVDRGVPYYKAFGDAFTGDVRFDKPQGSVAGWRMPTTFWLWAMMFRNGSDMVWAFVFWAAVAMGLAYYIASRLSDPVAALVAPALLLPYYVFAVSRTWFPELEFWAGFVGLIGAAFMVSDLPWPALGFATLAGAMREWFLAGIAAGLAQCAKQRRWVQAGAWAAAGLAVVAAYLVNMHYVRVYLKSVGITPGLGTAGRAANGGVGFILYTTRFCAEYFLQPVFIPYLVFFLALAVAGYLIYRGEYYLPVMFLLPVVAFLYFGSGAKPGDGAGLNDYYGASFMPFAFILVTGLGRLVELIPGVARESLPLVRPLSFMSRPKGGKRG